MLLSGIAPCGIGRSRRRRDVLDRRQTLGHSLLNNLVEHWPLDDARSSNSNVTQRGAHAGLSLSMGSNNPQDAKNPYWGQASQFTAASSRFLKRTSESALQMGDIDFACYAWFYPDTINAGQVIMGKSAASAGGDEWRLSLTATNVIRFVAWDGTNIVGLADHGTTASATTWHFVVAYHSATANQVGISLNGGAFATAATTGAPATTATEFRIGADARATPLYWNGRLWSLGIIKNYIPTVDDCLYLYNGGIGRKYPFV